MGGGDCAELPEKLGVVEERLVAGLNGWVWLKMSGQLLVQPFFPSRFLGGAGMHGCIFIGAAWTLQNGHSTPKNGSAPPKRYQVLA